MRTLLVLYLLNSLPCCVTIFALTPFKLTLLPQKILLLMDPLEMTYSILESRHAMPESLSSEEVYHEFEQQRRHDCPERRILPDCPAFRLLIHLEASLLLILILPLQKLRQAPARRRLRRNRPPDNTRPSR